MQMRRTRARQSVLSAICFNALSVMSSWLILRPIPVAAATAFDPAQLLVFALFVATVAGTLVPLGLKAMRVDPALASSVFITTFTDVVGFASFLGFATIFLRYLTPV